MNDTMMTDAEAWGVLGEMIAGAECLPELFEDTTEACRGLCSASNGVAIALELPAAQRKRLREQLDSYRNGIGYVEGYQWPEGAWRPRAKACKEISRLILEGKL